MKHYGWACHLGRVLVGLVFVLFGVIHVMGFDDNVMTLALHSWIPMPKIFFGVFAGVEILFGLLLAFGFMEALSAWLLILATLFSAFLFAHFWDITGPEKSKILIQFLSDIAIVVLLLFFGCCKKCNHCGSTNNDQTTHQ